MTGKNNTYVAFIDEDFHWRYCECLGGEANPVTSDSVSQLDDMASWTFIFYFKLLPLKERRENIYTHAHTHIKSIYQFFKICLFW